MRTMPKWMGDFVDDFLEMVPFLLINGMVIALLTLFGLYNEDGYSLSDVACVLIPLSIVFVFALLMPVFNLLMPERLKLFFLDFLAGLLNLSSFLTSSSSGMISSAPRLMRSI